MLGVTRLCGHSTAPYPTDSPRSHAEQAIFEDPTSNIP
jgi:hypothetical protein